MIQSPTATSVPRWSDQVISVENASRLAQRLSVKTGHLRSVVWSPTGRSIAVAASEGQSHRIDIIQIPSLTVNRLDGAMFTYDVLFAGDGTSVLAASHGTLLQWDAATGAVQREFADPRYQCVGLDEIAFSPDPDKVLTAEIQIPKDGPTQTEISAFSLQSGDCQGEYLSLPGAISSLETSPDGHLLLVGFSERPPGQSRVDVLDGRTLSLVCSLQGYSQGHLGAGGSLMAVGKAQIEVYALPECRLIRTLPNSWFQDDFAFSPDGSLLAAPNKNTLRLWSIATGEAVGVVATREGGRHLIAFGPDGRWLTDAWQSLDGEESEILFFAVAAR